jgi:putative restriction endonuclease
MTHAVFTTRVVPSYDDLPEERYHFPRTYLRQVEDAVGDVIVYYEPRRSGTSDATRGRMSYFATATVDRIEADRQRPDHFYAFVRDYIEFERAVPFADAGQYYESILRRADGATSKGAFGRAVRALPRDEFLAITGAGFRQTIREAPPEMAAVRTRVLSERAFRDRAFTLRVRSAYGGTCAMTGLRIENGGGWTEAQAAHVRPVADQGPDSVRNALLLSGTMHALFDRGFISVADDYQIIVAKVGLPQSLRGLFTPDLKLILPARSLDRPHPAFLGWHRKNRFKG